MRSSSFLISAYLGLPLVRVSSRQPRSLISGNLHRFDVLCVPCLGLPMTLGIAILGHEDILISIVCTCTLIYVANLI